VQSEQVQRIRNQQLAAARKATPTVKDALAITPEQQEAETLLGTLFATAEAFQLRPELKSLSPAQAQALWEETLEKTMSGVALAKVQVPLLAVYAEASGWYEFRGGGESDKQKNLFTFSVDYWFIPNRTDKFLRLRYENGYERGVPGEKKNQLLASIALKF
jgi:hypothetical protein